MRKLPERIEVDLGAVTLSYEVDKPLNLRVTPRIGQREGVEVTALQSAFRATSLVAERLFNPPEYGLDAEIKLDTDIRRELVFLKEQGLSPTANAIVGHYQWLKKELGGL